MIPDQRLEEAGPVPRWTGGGSGFQEMDQPVQRVTEQEETGAPHSGFTWSWGPAGQGGGMTWPGSLLAAQLQTPHLDHLPLLSPQITEYLNAQESAKSARVSFHLRSPRGCGERGAWAPGVQQGPPP